MPSEGKRVKEWRAVGDDCDGDCCCGYSEAMKWLYEHCRADEEDGEVNAGGEAAAKNGQ